VELEGFELIGDRGFSDILLVGQDAKAAQLSTATPLVLLSTTTRTRLIPTRV